MLRDNKLSDYLNLDRVDGYLDGFPERPKMAATADRAGIKYRGVNYILSKSPRKFFKF